VANDAKCQVTFNSEMVTEFRLIGYENRVMNREDFENDKKDAGEIGAGQTVTALYELVLDRQAAAAANQTFATFDFRYKKTLQSESTPLQLKLSTNQLFNKNGRSGDFYFAAGIAAYGMLLRDSPYKGDADIDMARSLVTKGLSFDPHGYRAKLLNMLNGERE
ncbi:MAG: YfbK domain-containing protein, partial [Prevotella sp.]